MIYVTEEQYLELYPKWVADAPIQTLADIWAARYGNEWVSITDVAGDFSFVASRLLTAQKLVGHIPAFGAVRHLKLASFEG